MNNLYYKSDYQFEIARQSLSDAARWLQAGQALNRVPQELVYAKMDAVKGWLLAHRIKPQGNYGDIWKQFSDRASRDIFEKVSHLSALWVSLEFKLLGDPDDLVDQLPVRQWVELAKVSMDEARQIVDLLEDDSVRIAQDTEQQ